MALRQTKSSDQAIVQSMALDNMNSLLKLLLSLRIGEAVIVGEVINNPSRLKLTLQTPRTDSSDPDVVETWNKEYKALNNPYAKVVTNIRKQKWRRTQMDRQYVDSSMIESIGYDAGTSVLEIEFKGGVVWAYENFPEYLWYEFEAAESKGKFFHKNIKEQYTAHGYRVE